MPSLIRTTVGGEHCAYSCLKKNFVAIVEHLLLAGADKDAKNKVSQARLSTIILVEA